jgi:FkbM family methyltransferase
MKHLFFTLLLVLQKPWSAREKWAISRTFCILKFNHYFNPGKQSVNVSFSRFTIYGAHYTQLYNLFSEIFINEAYNRPLSTAEPLILDCGANVGMATLFFKYKYPNARIHAFEPQAAMLPFLEKNVQANKLDKVTIHPVAVGDHHGTVTFYEAAGFSEIAGLYPERSGATAREVPMRPLSDFITEPVDLLKMDVEGAEWLLMKDIIRTGAINKVKTIVLEYHHQVAGQQVLLANFLTMLDKQGFKYQFETRSSGKIGDVQDILIAAAR